jgi:hypothetical protein
MPGKWINKTQVKVYMNARAEGHNQTVSALKSGISVRSGRDIEHGKHTDPHLQPRTWRTRKDPFGEVWASILEPMLEQAPALQAITLLEHLQSLHPDQYDDKLLRSLQRRVKTWKATKGPEKEVMFRQQQPPGHQGLSDFTTLKRISLTIQGQPFKHLIYHFRLPYSFSA